MKFIDYNKLKEFYTIKETCDLFEMPKVPNSLQRTARFG